MFRVRGSRACLLLEWCTNVRGRLGNPTYFASNTSVDSKAGIQPEFRRTDSRHIFRRGHSGCIARQSLELVSVKPERAQMPVGAAVDNLGAVHALIEDGVGNVTVLRSTASPWPGEQVSGLSSPFGNVSVATEPDNQLERVLSLRQESFTPVRLSLQLYRRDPGGSWTNIPVDPGLSISYDSYNDIVINNAGDTWLAATYHFISSGPRILRAWHVNPGTGSFDGSDLAFVDEVRSVSLRFAHGSFGPLVGREYSGIEPTPGQIALFYQGPTGWVFTPVDSNGAGRSVDVAMTSAGLQYVAYVKDDPMRLQDMVCLASRQLPEVGDNRPFQVDTLIRVGHLSNDFPVKVQLFLDALDRPVVLTFVGAQDPGSADRIYESVSGTSTTAVAGGRGIPGAGLYVYPTPTRLGATIQVAGRTEFEEVRIYDAHGRLVLKAPNSKGRRLQSVSISPIAGPGIYFVVGVQGNQVMASSRIVVTR